MSKELDTVKVAAQLDELAALVSAIAATFRNGVSAGAGQGVNGKTGGKPAGKPAGKAKPEAEEEVEIDEDAVREALKELTVSHGKEVMVSALASVGAARLADVDESQYAELMEKIDELKAKPVEGDDDDGDKKPAGKKPAAKKGKAKGPTADDAKEKFNALIEADKAVAKKLLKKFGAAKFSEIDFDEHSVADVIEAIDAAMPEDDDDLVG